MVLPLLKLGTLLLKTLSKPVAARLKQQAGLHPRFRQIIVSMAQANHQVTTRMQRRLYSHATDVEIRPLNEEKAVQAAVDLIGELFVFSVAVAVLIFEVQRNSRSEARKEELRKQELEVLCNTTFVKMILTQCVDLHLYGNFHMQSFHRSHELYRILFSCTFAFF
ncbi:hypothetical protein PRUPE_4G054400 [Prunus persica]|uniref:OPA3-like protein n=1 Tax=Prunus persica TaxID=3760 RepID=A0A251PG59_PRUPE|nr:hypothetical protein PRUPE_4G054400 [Prunus persica]